MRHNVIWETKLVLGRSEKPYSQICSCRPKHEEKNFPVSDFWSNVK